jgi:hypothetical protein
LTGMEMGGTPASESTTGIPAHPKAILTGLGKKYTAGRCGREDAVRINRFVISELDATQVWSFRCSLALRRRCRTDRLCQPPWPETWRN